jgi:quercetin dioxygenase-like cupin family protein
MGTGIRRFMRLGAMSLGFAGLLIAVNVAPGVATAPSGFASSVVARGTYTSHGSLRLQTGLDIVVVSSTVQPGGSSGWHSHPGGAIVVVQSGQITTYRSVRNEDEAEGGNAAEFHCVITNYTAGHSFIEVPGEALIAFNQGSSVTTIYATFPGVPAGHSPRTDIPTNPGTCPGV